MLWLLPPHKCLLLLTPWLRPWLASQLLTRPWPLSSSMFVLSKHVHLARHTQPSVLPHFHCSPPRGPPKPPLSVPRTLCCFLADSLPPPRFFRSFYLCFLAICQPPFPFSSLSYKAHFRRSRPVPAAPITSSFAIFLFLNIRYCIADILVALSLLSPPSPFDCIGRDVPPISKSHTLYVWLSIFCSDSLRLLWPSRCCFLYF